ncbi:hypothetical protein CXB51_019717 [Gossypium anomalum]|uniref:Uncharacterized protein n=1 Tax=Gossypium anomalum TaxID=47600 RepID=A0A8J5YIQ6_9ROSI|nr:hypothetical protein CXB51_019717 [Gossypium anomalum]
MGQPTPNGAVPMGSNIPRPYYSIAPCTAPPSPNAHRGGRRARYLGGVGAWHGVANDSEAWRASYSAWARGLRRRFPSTARVLGWLCALCIGLRDVG